MVMISYLPFSWPHRRASLIIASLASAPELQKKHLPLSESFESRCASSAWFTL